jgi:hypothetical protein
MQTTMTASEFEEKVGAVKSGWSDAVRAHLNNPNPNWHLEPDPFPRTHTPIRVSNPFEDNNV